LRNKSVVGLQTVVWSKDDKRFVAELYVIELKNLYNAEKQLTKALPKMAKASASPDLRNGFEQHPEQTKGDNGVCTLGNRDSCFANYIDE